MAQFYQVVDSGPNHNDEIQATYSNIVDNQGNHYILQTENEQQPFVLIDNMIESPVITQFDSQPVYLVESPPKQGEQTIQTVPVVLNHTLQSKVLMQPQQNSVQQPVIVSPPPLRNLPRARAPIHGPNASPPQILNNRIRVQTPRNAVTIGNVPRMPRGVVQTPRAPRANSPRAIVGVPALRQLRPGGGQRLRTPNLGQMQQQVQLQVQQQRQQVQPPEPANNQMTMVKLEDGRIMSMTDYQKFVEQKRLLAEQRPAPTIPNRVLTPQLPQIPLIRFPQQRPGMLRPQIRARLNSPRVARPPVQVQTPQQMPIVPPIEPPKRTARIIQPNQSTRLPRILREFTAPPEIKDLINRNINDEEFENSIRMFVLLVCGEQRLITFTTPKEDCTIQEILDQVGVPLQPDTKIAISEINTDGINLVVSVGYEDDDDENQQPDTTTNGGGGRNAKVPNQPVEPAGPLTPAPSPEPPPKLIPGKMAVCTHCGYLSEDFNKCVRCKRKLPDGIKAVNSDKAELLPKKKPTIAINLKPTTANAALATGSPLVTSGLRPIGNGSPALAGNLNKVAIRKKVKPKTIDQEPMVVTLSSDDEDDESEAKSNDAKPPVRDKEPTIAQLKESVPEQPKNINSLACTTISCRKISVGSYKYTPSHDVKINGKEMIIKVPHTTNKDQVVTLVIRRKQIYKVLVSFQKVLPVIFYYLLPNVAEKICSALGLEAESDTYFDPVSDNESHRRIVLLPTTLGEEDKWVLQTIYGHPAIIEELTPKEANSILMKICDKDVQAHAMNSQPLASLEVRQLLIYPPGKGGISINSEDYMCLERDQFLNDVIIDFYLKYVINQLAEEARAKVHVFSTFFYNRLTTKSARTLRKPENETALTASQKRHVRVKNWTKNIDLFEMDYIIIPINENAHWFLAIICFPGMNGPKTFDGVPVTVDQLKSPKKKVVTSPKPTTTLQVKTHKGNIALAPVEEDSDKDEAEGDDSELEVEEPEDAPATSTQPAGKIDGVPIKQPCILIFDSLAGASRARVVATLRDYLTCEYSAKKGTQRIFTKDIISGACPKIPQQNNYTDCGLYLLQYVENFFKTPIKDYRIPIKGLNVWFDEVIVTRKREDISNLIKELMITYNKDVNILPAIALPTQNGEPIENQSDEQEDEELDELKVEHESISGNSQESLVTHPVQSSQSSNHSNSSESDVSSVSTSTNSRQSAMSYLKAKRIVKVKADMCMEETKKIKLSE